MSDPAPRPSAAGTAALLVIGLVFLVPSGLCTGAFGFGALSEVIAHPDSSSEAMSFLVLALVIGGPFVAAGGVMVWLAIRRMRRSL